MEIKRLWTKFFSPKNEEEELALHIAGATVRHRNPFEELEVPRNDDQVTREFADKWVTPYYTQGLYHATAETINIFLHASNQFKIDDVKKLLGYLDWRPKITAAYFTAINNYTELEDIIGKLLLKSEVCFAGRGYCYVLAIFGTEKSKNYLKEYLQYYLMRKDLCFDQAHAFCALEYIDKAEANKFLDVWNDFISDKISWNLEDSRKVFLNSIENILAIRALANHQ